MVEQLPSKDVFYLQARGHTGNSLLWWREGRHGYTNDIRKAHVFTRDEAFAQHRCRPDTDFPWRKEYIDAHVQLHVVVDDIGHEDEQAFVSTAPESTDWQRIARERTADVRKADEKIERLQRELAHWKDCHSVTADMLAAARSSHEPCGGMTGWKKARCTKPTGHDGPCEFSPGTAQPPSDAPMLPGCRDGGCVLRRLKGGVLHMEFCDFIDDNIEGISKPCNCPAGRADSTKCEMQP